MGTYINKGNDGFRSALHLVGINYDKESKKHTCKIEKTHFIEHDTVVKHNK